MRKEDMLRRRLAWPAHKDDAHQTVAWPLRHSDLQCQRLASPLHKEDMHRRKLAWPLCKEDAQRGEGEDGSEERGRRRGCPGG